MARMASDATRRGSEKTCIGALEALPQPTVALIDGWAVGGRL